MKKFRVMVSVSADYEIEARNEEEARDKAEETWLWEIQIIGNRHISLCEIEKN